MAQTRLSQDYAGDEVLLRLQVAVHAGHVQRRARQAKLGFDFAEFGDHAVVTIDEHLGLLASRHEEHDVGVGVVPGAHGELVGAVVGGDTLTDIGRRHRGGHGHPHLRAASCPAASKSSIADFVELEETLLKYRFPLTSSLSSQIRRD